MLVLHGRGEESVVVRGYIDTTLTLRWLWRRVSCGGGYIEITILLPIATVRLGTVPRSVNNKK